MNCEHLNKLVTVEPNTIDGCEDCLKIGGTWVHLRLCQSCGHVGCCDSSPNRHATEHFRLTTHPVMQSFEPGEFWAYCYVDETIVDNIGDRLDRSHR